MGSPPRIPRLLRGIASCRTRQVNRLFQAQVQRCHSLPHFTGDCVVLELAVEDEHRIVCELEVNERILETRRLQVDSAQ